MTPVGRSKRFTASSTRTASQKYEIKTTGKPSLDPNVNSSNIDDKYMETTSSVKNEKTVKKVTVEPCPHQKDPRLSAIVAKSSEKFLKILKSNSITRSLNMNILDNTLVTGPVSPKDKSASSIIKSSKSDHPNRPNSIKKTRVIMNEKFVCQCIRCHVNIKKGECDSIGESYNNTNFLDIIDTKQSYLFPGNIQTISALNLEEHISENLQNESKQVAVLDEEQDEEIEFVPETVIDLTRNTTEDIVKNSADDIIVLADKIVPKELFMQIYNTKPKKVSAAPLSLDKVNHKDPLNSNSEMGKKKIVISAPKSSPEKFVCQCIRCHVNIKKGECDSIGESYNNTNFLDIIDTKQSYLFPGNIQTISALNLEEHISENLQNESKQVAVFDEEQDEEIEFVPETVIDLTRNTTEDIVKNSADDIIVLADKIVPKELFMQIYNTKPKKVSAAPLSLDKVNHKDPLNSNSEMGKKKIVISAPKSSPEKFVCQCIRCHVNIKKGECDSIGESYNNTNFLDIIDTKQSYLFPGNIQTISALNLEEHISENLQNESKQVAVFDEEQDEEIEFVPETVIDLTRNTTEDIVKNSADDIIVLADKIVPKELFMQIYNTKPKKVSAVPLSLDKVNHKDPLNSNSEMGKKKIVISAPKSSPEKFVCQCIRCHVNIKKGECDSIGESYNNTNFLDIIDTKQSYLFPGNIQTISALNLEEHISENLQNESKQVAVFDEEQDEEIEFVPETVIDLTRNTTEDIVKNSADDIIVLADKIVPKELFMQIYNTKPKKVSAAPLSLDKVNHKDPLNSNSEMGKKKIVISAPKSSPEKFVCQCIRCHVNIKKGECDSIGESYNNTNFLDIIDTKQSYLFPGNIQTISALNLEEHISENLQNESKQVAVFDEEQDEEIEFVPETVIDLTRNTTEDIVKNSADDIIVLADKIVPKELFMQIYNTKPKKVSAAPLSLDKVNHKDPLNSNSEMGKKKIVISAPKSSPEKFVCQCIRCHVNIKKGECDSIGESYNNTNFLDIIDTKQSYLFPGNIQTISALNLEEHISENLQNESKQVAVFDEEQDEEIEFVPETVIDLTRNTTEDIVKNSADDIIVLADKIVPKELFMQIYNTKPKKVSAAPLSLDKVNHKDPLNSNSEMGKKKIVISAPKSSPEKFVCQCIRCHVNIKKGECDSIGESYNNTNFLDIIDTKQSYLFPGNIQTISALNLEEHISENLQNESKQVAVFDEEQDEEIEFVPETVIDLTRNTTEDIVKNSADDIIVLADKIVPKELFMQIYNTKPKKVSAAPLSLDKVNHKDPLNSNSEMGKKKIVISAPKSSPEKFVCQCIRCHVNIKKGECDSIGESYNNTNFLDIIDTKQSYLFPGNIQTISALNLEEHISENLQNESKQVAVFDEEQDEEIEFVPETVIDLTRNTTEDIVKNSADDIIVLADKIVPKELFMQIYNTKPKKVSAAPLSLDKVNHKDPLNSNSEMGKKKIVISAPKSSPEKFVCQCIRCHVNIKKGECDSIGESYNNTNFLDIIDTKQSYLFPGNIQTISALNLEEHISENLQNESKQVAVFDEEQDEEIEFVPETVIDLTRNTTEDIVKNSADDIIVLADKIVPKELFMQIYNTKPKKVSAAPLSLDKVNHKDPLNSNSEMGKKKIVISAPKSSPEKFVCQCIRCHVNIKKGECDSIGESYNNTNFLDIIDTKQSYLFPGNIQTISALNLEEHISENLQNESKQVAVFDEEQDEEIEFVPETVIDLTRNTTEDIVKNSADDIIVLADKIVPKELFMQIYNTKPKKVSAAPLSLDEVNHKDPLNSNSEMGKKKIVISAPKSSSTKLDNSIRKKLYDPESDFDVCEKRLLELFDDDLSVSTSDSNVSLGDTVENATGSKFLGKSNLRRKYPFKQASLTSEDAYMTPKKISNRRKTTCFSSFSKYTEISKNNIPAVSCLSVITETLPLTAMSNTSNHLEQLKQLETSQSTINNLSGTSESSASASVAANTIQLIAKEIAITDVSNHSQKMKQIETLKNTSQHGDVSGSEIISNFELIRILEGNSDHDQQIVVPRDENKFSKITTSPSYISPENNLEKFSARFSVENENRQMMSKLLEKEVFGCDIGKPHEELESCINLEDFKEGDEEYCAKIKTIESIHDLTQMESESRNENGERDVNMKISCPPFDYNDKERKKILSMPKLEETERRQMKKKALRDIEELTLKSATSVQKNDECYEKVMSICDRSSIEPSFSVSSEMSEYLEYPNNVESSEGPSANDKPAALPPSEPVSNSSDQNQSQNIIYHDFYPVELGRMYYQFYDRVAYILKGYIPLQKAYSESFKIIYETFRRFPHSYNNFKQESLSLSINIFNRRKLYSRYLLKAILKLPTGLPQFHFAHFFRLTTELLNKAGIPISIPVVAHHLLAVMLVCNADYKQNKTSDKFKKTLESFYDTLNNKNGTNQPEFEMTMTQRYRLTMQNLTLIQLHQNKKTCSEISERLHHYNLKQQHHIENANSNGIQETLGTCLNENPTNKTQHSVIQNSDQSNRSSKPLLYPNLGSILNKNSSDPTMQLVVPNTRTIISSSSRQPPTCTSDRDNCTNMNGTIPMKYPILVNCINSVSDKIKIRENPPVNKITNNQVLPILPMINSSVPQSRIYAHSSSLQVIPLMTNSPVQSSHLQKFPSTKKFEGHSITNVSSGELSSMSDKVDDKKTDVSDTTIPATKENTILVPNNCIPHISIISNKNQLESHSISKDLPVGPSRVNQPQSNEMTTPSTSEVLKLKTQSSRNHNSVDSKADITYTDKKEQTSLNECNMDVINEKSSNEAEKYESSDKCVDSVDCFKEEIDEKMSFCEDEMNYLTWIDDFTEEELKKEDNGHEFMCIKNEPSVTCSEVMEYTMFILENRLCLCGKMAVYLCHCNTAMYCSQQCQLIDWPKHRRVCHSSSAT